MHKRRIRMVVWLASLGLALALIVLILSSIFAHRFDRIAYGTSRADVQAALGPPFLDSVVWNTDHPRVYLWQEGDDESLILGFDAFDNVNFRVRPGLFTKITGRLKDWLGI